MGRLTEKYYRLKERWGNAKLNFTPSEILCGKNSTIFTARKVVFCKSQQQLPLLQYLSFIFSIFDY